MSDWLEGPILFLDIDGVLNSTAYAMRRTEMGLLGIDPGAIPHLQRIVDESGCSLVLSSTWRLGTMLAEIRGKLIAAGMRHPVPLRDRTPHLPNKLRGHEVGLWLEDAGFKGSYVCLDDDCDFLDGQPLVRTDHRVGLTAADADRCISILGSSANSSGGRG